MGISLWLGFRVRTIWTYGEGTVTMVDDGGAAGVDGFGEEDGLGEEDGWIAS